MTALIQIQGVELPVLDYRGRRVVTMAMVDQVHRRPEGTARRAFNEHRERFIEGEDYFQTTPSELREHFVRTAYEIPKNHMVPVQGRGVTLLTETGYLMLVKSLTDDLSWEVQRKLVACYFRARESAALAPATDERIARIETAMEGIVKALAALAERSTLPVTTAANAPRKDVDRLLTLIKRLARLRARNNRTRCDAETSKLHGEIRDQLQYPAMRGNTWVAFPGARLRDLRVAIDGLQAEIDRLEKANQPELPLGSGDGRQP